MGRIIPYMKWKIKKYLKPPTTSNSEHQQKKGTVSSRKGWTKAKGDPWMHLETYHWGTGELPHVFPS